MFDLIKKLTGPFGVSGLENEIASIIEKEIKDYADEIKRDALGNLIAVKRSDNIKDVESPELSEKIMLAAHMDTIGIIVTHIEDEGYIRFSNVGGIKPHFCPGRTIEFSNGIRGVIYHDDSIKEVKDIKISSLYIDTGLKADEVKNKLKPGSYGRFVFATYTQGDSVISGYLDDRAGCAVLIETAKMVFEEMGRKAFPDNKEIHYVFTVQEEIGLRGAGPAAYNINPDIAIAVDVTRALDTPGNKSGSVRMGAGPVIKIKDDKTISHPYIKDRLKTVAEELNIPYQFGISTNEGTDAGVIHKTQGGIITGGLSIASRYVHTPAEMCSLSDLKNAVLILAEALRIEI